METEKRRFFVIGYPRSRTAWLSVLLNGDGVRCEHEASPEEMDSWEESIVGTCNSGLLFRVPELIEQYPNARWVMIHRNSKDALASMMADRPHEAAMWAEKWPQIDEAFWGAVESLEHADLLFVHYNNVDSRATDIVGHCAGPSLSRLGLAMVKAENLKNLRITQIPPRAPAIPDAVRQSAVERLRGLRFDLSGLTVRRYEPARDSANFVGWADRDQGSGAHLIPLIPPLGVVVEDESGPAAMIFCRECYGVPAADLEFSVARPGLSLKKVSAAMAFAVAACIELAGKLVVPPAEYSVFRATCRPSLGRFMKRLGFAPHGPDNCQKYIYQKGA